MKTMKHILQDCYNLNIPTFLLRLKQLETIDSKSIHISHQPLNIRLSCTLSP